MWITWLFLPSKFLSFPHRVDSWLLGLPAKRAMDFFDAYRVGVDSDSAIKNYRANCAPENFGMLLSDAQPVLGTPNNVKNIYNLEFTQVREQYRANPTYSNAARGPLVNVPMDKIQIEQRIAESQELVEQREWLHKIIAKEAKETAKSLNEAQKRYAASKNPLIEIKHTEFKSPPTLKPKPVPKPPLGIKSEKEPPAPPKNNVQKYSH